MSSTSRGISAPFMQREGERHTDTDSNHQHTSLQSSCCPSAAHPRHWNHSPTGTMPYHPALQPPVKRKSQWNSAPWRGRVGDTNSVSNCAPAGLTHAGQLNPGTARTPLSAQRSQPAPAGSPQRPPGPARTCGSCGRPAAPRSSSWAGPCRPSRSPARTRTCSWPWRGRGGRAGSPGRSRQRWPRPPGSSAA